MLGYTSGITNPSYLAVDSQQRYLYAVQETDEGKDPAVFAFAIVPETGDLQYLNHQPASGSMPCHITVDSTDRYVLAANYGTGNVLIYPVLGEGQLGTPTDMVQHRGSSINPERQEGPHAHAVVLDPENRFAFVSDLGLDRIMTYRLNPKQGKLTPHNPPYTRLVPGSGPRHLVFHGKGRHAFGSNELNATISVFAYDDGTLTPLQTVSTLPPGFDGERSGAAIRVAASGRVVYGSNRGHDSIAIFAFNEPAATLSLVGHELTQGHTPRDFVIDPSGAYLLAANQDTDTVVAFRIDQQTGQLEPTGQVAHIPNPASLVFAHRT